MTINLWHLPIGLLIVGLIYSFLTGFTPAIISLIYLTTSLITFALYAKDKRAARNGQWRTPESILQLWAFLGGWPGALAGQYILRHKTQKTRFLMIFWLALITNVSLLIFIHTPPGAEIFRTGIDSASHQLANQFESNAGVTVFLKLMSL